MYKNFSKWWICFQIRSNIHLLRLTSKMFLYSLIPENNICSEFNTLIWYWFQFQGDVFKNKFHQKIEFSLKNTNQSHTHLTPFWKMKTSFCRYLHMKPSAKSLLWIHATFLLTCKQEMPVNTFISNKFIFFKTLE